MRWPLIKYVDKLSKPWAAGCARGPFIKILKSHRKDAGLYQHELVHVKQWFITLGLHTILYKFSVNYRLRTEVAAYLKQLKYCKNKERCRALFAGFIYSRYDLDISAYKAKRMLN